MYKLLFLRGYMEAFVSAVVTLVLVGVGIAIMTGQISPQEVVKRLVGIGAVILVALLLLMAMRDIVLPALIPTLHATARLALKFLFAVVAIAVIGIVAAAVVTNLVRTLLKLK